MPIGLLIGACIGLMIAGALMIAFNATDHRKGHPMEVQIAQGQARMQGWTMFIIGTLSLIGTLIELYVR